MKIKSKIVSLVLVAAIVPILIMGISSYILGLKTSLRTTEIFYQGALNQGASSFNSYFSSVNKKLGLFSKDYASTLDKNVKTKHANKEAAKELGLLIAKKAAEKKIETVVFDRGGYIYHGVVKELAEAAREGGLEF